MRTDVPAFFLAGPTRTVVGEGERESFQGTLRSPERWLAEIDRALAASDDPRGSFVVGALPFGEDAPVRLFRPVHGAVSDAWGATSEPARAVARTPIDRVAHDESGGFVDAVAQAAGAIRRGALKKVVLARAKELTVDERPDVRALLSVLRARNPHGFTYSLDVAPGASEPTRLVGASPELLLSRRGATVVSVPLAGSIPRSADPVEDRERAARLLRSPKDRHEHEIVVEHVVASLAPLTRTLRFEREPVVSGTPTMWHLSTRIEGTLRDRDLSSLRLAVALHPTPAVCGLPTRDAREWIARLEGLDRGYFTGALGYTRAGGDGDWIVAIRCAEIAGARVRVFAGAGIVGSSDPELELAETSAKMRTVLGALVPSRDVDPPRSHAERADDER
ncbi:isochorismate synthase [Sandaracinus amylolyticus]|uniref:isochorismate synthase n=1 Tax=Sandaracinus amylolyticus TaxID=927083 RepID=UPI001F006C20|nr:isochorismate synthase [Sandaracinus amylolyticus]UJR78710.1 Isochorismate synthase of siderophore biosynthesis [Sandaracinus amylolyticus]